MPAQVDQDRDGLATVKQAIACYEQWLAMVRSRNARHGAPVIDTEEESVQLHRLRVWEREIVAARCGHRD